MNKIDINPENLTWKTYLAGMTFWALVGGTIIMVAKTLKK
jgi:hypothetical protein